MGRHQAPTEATRLHGALRDRPERAALRAPPALPLEPHGIVLQFSGSAQGSWLETATSRDPTDFTVSLRQSLWLSMIRAAPHGARRCRDACRLVRCMPLAG